MENIEHPSLFPPFSPLPPPIMVVTKLRKTWYHIYLSTIKLTLKTLVAVSHFGEKHSKRFEETETIWRNSNREFLFNNTTWPEQNSIYSLDAFHLRRKSGVICMFARKWCKHLELSFVIQASEYLYCTNLHLDKHLRLRVAKNQEIGVYFSTKVMVTHVTPTIHLTLKLGWFPNEGCYWA